MIDIETLPKQLGKKIKIERVKHEVSQEELADWSDISVATLSKLERGEVLPTVETIAKVANALRLSLQDVFDFNF